MVVELVRRNEELVKIIGVKDKEIDDYKFQGVKIFRKYIEILVFVSIVFENKMIMLKEFEEEVKKFGFLGFFEDNQDLYR